MLGQLLPFRVGQDVARAQVALGAQVEVGEVDIVTPRAKPLDGLLGYLRADPVPAYHRQFHVVKHLLSHSGLGCFCLLYTSPSPRDS